MNVRDVLECTDFKQFKAENGITTVDETFTVEEWRGNVWLGVVLGGGLFWWIQWDGIFNEVIEREVVKSVQFEKGEHDLLTSWMLENSPNGGLRLTFQTTPHPTVCMVAPNGMSLHLS